MLRSAHVPPHLAHLDRVWVRHPTVPLIKGFPHYVSIEEGSSTHICRTDERWIICDGALPRVLIYAFSYSPALHPNTILPGEWVVVEERFPDRCVMLPDFHLCADVSGSTAEDPLMMEDVGLDFFLRITPTHPVWFVDPFTHAVRYSGTKMGSNGTAGVRFCSVCSKCVSANNFVSQHLSRVHPEMARPCRVW